MGTDLGAKQLELLHELIPQAARFAVLVNPKSPLAEPTITEVQRAASAIRRPIEILAASSHSDIDVAFASVREKQAAALLVSGDTLFVTRRVQIVTLAAHHAVPAIYFNREFVEAGGLMSYGSSATDRERQLGIYTGRILKGEKPADLPVQQSTKVELIINLKTAKMLGITVPHNLLVGADEVIE